MADNFNEQLQAVKDLWQEKGLTRKRGCPPLPKSRASAGILRKLSESSESDDDDDNLEVKSPSFEALATALESISSEKDLNLAVYIFDGELLALDVKASDTIASIKVKIQDMTRITVEHQNLINLDRQLEDDKTLSEYNIQKESVVYVDARLVLLYSKLSGSTDALLALPTSTVLDVKAKISETEWIPVEDLRLLRGDEELENGRTLLDYNIQNREKLQIVVSEGPMSQFLRSHGNIRPFHVGL